MLKVLVAALVLASSVGYAAGDSGCGLGSVVIQKNSKLLQLFSMTTNGTFFSQGFGITSGTSGCSASGIVKADQQMEYFVEVNNDDLSREMARGNGEKLDVLAQMHGCNDKASQAAFSSMAKDSFQKIYSKSDEKAQDVIAHIKSEIKNNLDVQHMCHIASL